MTACISTVSERSAQKGGWLIAVRYVSNQNSAMTGGSINSMALRRASRRISRRLSPASTAGRCR